MIVKSFNRAPSHLGSGEVHPWAYLPDGSRINLYSNPTAFVAAMGLQPSGAVSVSMAKKAVLAMLDSVARAGTPSAQLNVGSSFHVTDENAPPSERTVRFTKMHIDPAIAYANATGDHRVLDGVDNVVVGPDGHAAIDYGGSKIATSLGLGAATGRGYDATGLTRGLTDGGSMQAAARAHAQHNEIER